jgi:hypothetical protein
MGKIQTKKRRRWEGEHWTKRALVLSRQAPPSLEGEHEEQMPTDIYDGTRRSNTEYRKQVLGKTQHVSVCTCKDAYVDIEDVWAGRELKEALVTSILAEGRR